MASKLYATIYGIFNNIGNRSVVIANHRFKVGHRKKKIQIRNLF